MYKKKRKDFHGIRHPIKEPSNDIPEIPSSSSVAIIQTPTTSISVVVASLDASVRKFGKAVEESPVKMSRERKREATVHNNSDVSPADGYKIIDASILQSILNCILNVIIVVLKTCYHCNKITRREMVVICEMLIFHCTSCNTDIKSFKTSHTVNNKMADINLRSVLANTAVGGGPSVDHQKIMYQFQFFSTSE